MHLGPDRAYAFISCNIAIQPRQSSWFAIPTVMGAARRAAIKVCRCGGLSSGESDLVRGV